MSSTLMKITFAGFVIMMGAVYLFQPLMATFSGEASTVDFTLQSPAGTLDSRALRGKLLLVTFAYAGCPDDCISRLGRSVQPFTLLNAAERSRVRFIVVTVDPENDTPQRIEDFARRIHPELVGASGTPQQIEAIAAALGARFQRLPANADGRPIVQHSPLTYLLMPDGRYTSVLQDGTAPEKVVQLLREKLPRDSLPRTPMPPGG